MVKLWRFNAPDVSPGISWKDPAPPVGENCHWNCGDVPLAAQVKVADSPWHAITGLGSSVMVGGLMTETCAGDELTVLHVPETKALYLLLWYMEEIDVNVSAVVVVPENTPVFVRLVNVFPESTLSCHVYETPVPIPATLNVALWPSQVACAVGCVVIETFALNVSRAA
jgi:hypothetical protein